MTDERSRAGNDPVAALYLAELARVVRLGYLLTGSGSAAEEIAQEAFTRLIARYSTIRKPEAFLTTVVVNLCRDRGRRSTTVAKHQPAPPGAAQPPELPHDVGEMWLAVQRLPSQHREAVILRYWADLSTREVARLLDIPTGTARSHLHRAITALKKELTS